MSLSMPAVDGISPAVAGTLPSIPDRLVSALAPAHRTAWGLDPRDELAPGRRVARRLGGSERYETYVVWDERLLAPVVAKVLRPHLVGEPRARADLAAEAVALNTLAHPALVRGFGAQLDAPAPHLLLELLDGPRLSTVIRRVGHLSSDEVVRIAGQISAALHYLSGEGWIHLGITPRTIMMSGPPRLIDLGAARPVSVDRRRPGIIDPAYLAPEQIDPARSSEIGPPADVFALAATLFEALTGRPPFAPRPGLRYPQLTAERPVAPERTPALLGSLLRAALSPLPERRPTAAALHVTLDDLARSGRNARRLRHR